MRGLWRTLKLIALIIFHKDTFVVYRFGKALGDQLLITSILEQLCLVKNVSSVSVITSAPEFFWRNPRLDQLIDIKRLSRAEKIVFKTVLKITRNKKSFQFAYPSNDFESFMRGGGENLSLVDAYTIGMPLMHPLMNRNPKLYVSVDEIKNLNKKFDIEPKYCVISPFSKTEYSPNKARNTELIFDSILLSDIPCQMVCVNDEEVKEIPSHLKNLTGKLSLRELIVLIASAEFVLAWEGLPNHIAAAFQTKSFVVMGGFSQIGIADYDTTHVIREKQMPECAPCWRLDACPVNKECFSGLDAENVSREIVKVYNEKF